jgi:peroxiredoxin
MAATASTMLPLGTKAPDFTLLDANGDTVSLENFPGAPGILVMFICNHCPYVKHIQNKLAKFGREYQEKGLGIIAISANDVDAYPDDHPDRMKEEAKRVGYTFPYLYDESQEVAKAYRAACTPDFFLFDADHLLVYRGQFDPSRPGNDIAVTGGDLKAAVDALLQGRTISDEQIPSIGCNIKWKPGNEPDYFAG